MIDTLKIIDHNEGLAIKPFSKITQKILNWFVFFLAFPSVELFGNSITFYLFIAIGLRIGSFWTGVFRGKTLLGLFLILAFVSTISAPYMRRNPGFFDNVKILVQYVYWIFVSFFFINQRKRIDFLQLSKWIFFGAITAIVGFYFYAIKFSTPIISIRLAPSRNDFVFNLLCTIPISFYYILQAWNRKKGVLLVPFFLVVMLLTGGRSGAVLIILELILVLTIIYPALQKLARIVTPVCGLLFILSQTDLSQVYLNSLADEVESLNPRFANLLRGVDEGDLSFDKSWLERKLMVEKGLEIFKEYPIRGIGPNNFYYFDSKLSSFYEFDRLGGDTIEYYNSRSAHNSYIQVLSEMGILGLSILIGLIIVPLFFFFRKFFSGKMDLQFLPFVSLLGISMHLYAITALTGANSWMIIGLSWGVLNSSKR
ncbi:MAG: O-antigen polymerase [Ferruginibacter sp.]|nr:O-antigen polymerase [Ferruginibacter sp.]